MADDRLYLDTNIFIYAFENNDRRAQLLLQLIASNEARTHPFLATGEISLAELVVEPLRQGNQLLVALYGAISVGNGLLSVAAVTRDILWHAAQLRAQYANLRLPDAIHLSCAMHLGCSRFLTGDTKLRGAYSIAPNPLVPHDMVAEVLVIRPDIPVLETIIGEFSS